ncbi:MAG: hypothetical protein FJ276_05225 [Planctomycetes bacterium]|nr:hypothetical protein [Planctomycetota bacterium]
MEPLISIRVRDQHRPFRPGEELECEYQLDAVDADDIQALEVSVLWHTEGKGDEDLAVHYFERLVPADVPERDLRALRLLHTRLPNSPLTYFGVALKIRWCVRLRVFLRRGKDAFFEQAFVLGDIPKWPRAEQEEPKARVVVKPDEVEDEDD